MVGEIVDYRLHRYVVRQQSKRVGEPRRVRDTVGAELDARFVVESRAGVPIAVFIESAGGTSGSGAARNVDYVAGFDILLDRMRTLDLTIEDAYIDTSTTVGMPIPDRRLDVGDGRALLGAPLYHRPPVAPGVAAAVDAEGRPIPGGEGPRERAQVRSSRRLRWR